MRAGLSKGFFSIVAVLLAVGLVSGCGGGGSSKPAFDEAAAQAQVKANWEKFWSPAGTTAEHTALLENGSAYAKAIEAQLKNPLARSAKTTVTKVAIDPSHTTATVTYNIAISGANVITGGEGQAIFQDGTWKVSKNTFCELANAGAPGTCP